MFGWLINDTSSNVHTITLFERLKRLTENASNDLLIVAYQNIIKVYNHNFSNQWTKNLIHLSHKGDWSIRQAK